MPRQPIITLEYSLYDRNNRMLNTTEANRPFVYDPKQSQIISGLKRLLQGRSVGDSFEALLNPKEAFGERENRLQQRLPINAFSHLPNLTIGMVCEVRDGEEMRHAKITQIDEEHVTLDANHDFSGQSIIIRGRILAVR